jgi:hypothetical protein
MLRARIPNTLAQTITMLNNTMSLALYLLIETFFVAPAISLMYWSVAVGLLLVAPLDGVAAQRPQIWRETRAEMLRLWRVSLKVGLGVYLFILLEMFLVKVCHVTCLFLKNAPDTCWVETLNSQKDA